MIRPGTSLRIFAYLFLKLSRRTFIKISLIIKECPEEILIKLTIVLKAETLIFAHNFENIKKPLQSSKSRPATKKMSSKPLFYST